MFTYSAIPNSLDIRRSDGLQILCLDGIPQYEEFKLWLSDGNVLNPAPPKTLEQLFIEIDYACDKHYDAVAATQDWGRVGVTPSAACYGRTGYPNPWQSSAIKFATWVDSCVAYLIAEKAKVIAGTRTMPTPAEAVAELPPMVW